jgi:hypothetical protein
MYISFMFYMCSYLVFNNKKYNKLQGMNFIKTIFKKQLFVRYMEKLSL